MDTRAHRVMAHAFMAYSKHQDVAELGVLYDARIVKLTSDDMILTGFERADFDLREYRQAWLLRPITQAEMDTPIRADVVRGRGKVPSPPPDNGDKSCA
ncbi:MULTISPECIES: hypothetical protein [Cupriavidus]|uniref:Uncharacterized protein n=2 Tax=Burkholderiaceae TaxID=119060 RepID=A0A3G8GUL3_9BURK|nr:MULTISPECIES: hypothetical protein [Cupriavidus]AZG11966.1 hypothetical protein EHF44_00300 [Cupriavidus pauculus]MCA3193674.1 hypothetical protein [Cupriavidus sp.]MCA3233553.1 hypothetical protein [Cupriavidus sp.]